MKFQKKTFIIFTLLFLVAAVPPAIILPIVFKQKEKALQQQAEINLEFDQNHRWNIAKFKEEIKDEKNSIAYFGTSKCPACKEFTKKTENSSQLKEHFKEVKKELNQENIWIGYYDDLETDSEEKMSFGNKLNEFLKERKKENDLIKQVNGTPHIFIIKEGKIVAQLEGGEATIDNIIKESEKAYLDKE